MTRKWILVGLSFFALGSLTTGGIIYTVLRNSSLPISLGNFFFPKSTPLSDPELVVKSYLDSNTFKERARYVLDADRVRPEMVEYYKDKSFPTKYIEMSVKGDARKVGDWVGVRVVLRRGKNAFGVEVEEAAWYDLQRTASGYLIGWEDSIGYNPMSFPAYKAQRPEKPMEFRVLAKLDDHYNYEFLGGGNLFYSIELRPQNHMFQYLDGYVEKRSPTGQKLYEILKDGRSHALILILRYPQYSDSTDIVHIDGFVRTYLHEQD